VTLRTLGHSVRNHIATGKRSVSREQVVEDLDQLAQPCDSDAADRHEQSARVAARLEGLPDDMRELLMGRFFDELSYAELTIRMGRSEGALRVLYTRALRRLRDEMGASGG
jgi:RNA polymerase sigma factor (sigma-70 family)